MKIKGLCHDCLSSGVEIELDKFSKPICVSCREELAAIKRKEQGEIIMKKESGE